MSIRTLILGFALALSPTAFATEDDATDDDATETPVADDSDDAVGTEPALDREELKAVLASSVRLELDAFRVLMGVLEKASKDGKGGEGAATAYERAKAAFAEAETMADTGHYKQAAAKLRDAWRGVTPVIKSGLEGATDEELSKIADKLLSSLGERIAAMGPHMGSAPAESQALFDAGEALYADAKELRANGDAKGGFRKAREAMIKVDQATAMLMKSGRKGSNADRGTEGTPATSERRGK